MTHPIPTAQLHLDMINIQLSLDKRRNPLTLDAWAVVDARAESGVFRPQVFSDQDVEIFGPAIFFTREHAEAYAEEYDASGDHKSAVWPVKIEVSL